MQLALLPRELTPETVLSALQERHGAANGITAHELVHALTGRIAASDERRLRQIVEKLTRDGHPICAHPAHGYFWAASPADVDEAVRFLVDRAMTSLSRASALKRVALPDLYGQFGLLPSSSNDGDAPMRYSITTGQRTKIGSLFRQIELDRTTITLMHQPAMRQAGLWCDAYMGDSVDALLDRLTQGQASSYIAALIQQAGDP